MLPSHTTTCRHCGRELSRVSADGLCTDCGPPAEIAAGTAHPVPQESLPASTRFPAPATAALVVLNVLVFAVMALRGVSILHPTPDQLLRWGANFGPLALDGQWWRLFTCMFVHIGLIHLLLNMWALWDVGFLAEQLYGPRTFLAVYLMSGVAGSLASLARNATIVSAGASGAIFGLAGALIATLYLGKLPVERKALRASLVSLLVFAGYNLVYGFLKAHIDNGAHVGGLVAGLLLGFVLSRDFHIGRADSHLRRFLFPIFGVILIAATFSVRYMQMPVVRIHNAETALAKGDVNGGVRMLNEVIRERPQFAPAWLLLGVTQARMGQFTAAEPTLIKASQLAPKDTAALAQLSVLYLRTGQYERARAALQRMAEVNPKDADTFVNLGVTLNQLGRAEEAAAALHKAVALNPTLPLAQFNLGLTEMNLKRYDEAIAAFSRTTKLAPNDAEAWIWLANAYQSKGMSQEADAAYAKAYQLRARGRRR